MKMKSSEVAPASTYLEHRKRSHVPKRSSFLYKCLHCLRSLFSIRTIFLVLLALALIVISVIVWVLVYSGSSFSIQAMMSALREKAAESVVTNIEEAIFTDAKSFTRTQADMVFTSLNDLNIDNDELRINITNALFYSIVKGRKEMFNSVNFVRKDGALIAFSYDTDIVVDPYRTNINFPKKTRKSCKVYITDPDLGCIPSSISYRSFTNYTLTIPTYAQAVATSYPYQFFPISKHNSLDNYVTSIARKIYDRSGNFIGTLNIVFFLESIKKTIEKANPSKLGFVVVMQDDEVLVADSLATPPTYTTERCAKNDTEIKALCALITSKGGLSNFGTDADMELPNVGMMRIVRRVLEENGIKWHIFVALADTEFFSSVINYSITTIWVSIIVVVVAIFIAFVVTFSFLRTLAKLAACFAQIQTLNLHAPVIKKAMSSRGSLVYEVAILEANFKSMLTALKSFTKYIPQQIVKDLVSTQQEARAGLYHHTCTVFFLDVKDFTAISEMLGPIKLVEVIGDLFNGCTKLIMQNDGVIDKYIGDCIMAFWNAPAEVEDHELKAVRAAVEIQHFCQQNNLDLPKRDLPTIMTRIGIHTGDVMVGNFGSSDRLNFTVLGDTVNLASRLEGINKMYGTSIIISEDTYHAACDQLDKVSGTPNGSSKSLGDQLSYNFVARRVEKARVKGKQQAKIAYEVIPVKDASHIATLKAALPTYEAAFDYYLAGLFAKAIQKFTEFSNQTHELMFSLYGKDDPIIAHKLKICSEFVQNPPTSWEGIITMNEK